TLVGTGMNRIFNLHNGKGIFADNSDLKDKKKCITKVCSGGVVNNGHSDNAQNQGFELVHPNNHLIYELLKHVKGMDLQIPNSRISMTQDNNRISKKSPRESPLLMV
ncbi:hypothetical protein STEG23_000619, partial [Scotinomys teguina]